MLVVSFYKIRFLALKSADYLNLDVNQFNSSLLENVNVSLYQFLIIQGGNLATLFEDLIHHFPWFKKTGSHSHEVFVLNIIAVSIGRNAGTLPSIYTG